MFLDAKQSNPMFIECENICFASKNIYNRSLYLIKSEYEENKSYNNLNNLYSIMQSEDCYKQLPSKVSQQTLRMVVATMKSFFEHLKVAEKGEKVNTPHFLHKTKGRYIARYSIQSISKKVFDKAHKVKLSGCNIEVYTKIQDFADIACVRVVPKLNRYVIEIVYNVADTPKLRNNRTYASIDLGIDNLVTMVSNKEGFQPILINGKPLKSMNQYYNKRLAHYKSKLEKKQKTSKRIKSLTNKRTDKVNDYMHKASKKIVDTLVQNDICCLVIGKNDGWKQEVNIGKANNQNFVSLPHSRFVSMLTYKCERKGIEVRLQEESYTSKCSFLDNESIEKHDEYVGKRVKRGLFRSKEGKLINADVNGAYNILRKAVPRAVAKGIEGLVVIPQRITL